MIKHMLCKLGSKVDLNKKGFIAEPKLDGTRVFVYIEGKKIRLINRRGKDITYRYPELKEIYRFVKARKALLDAELVVFNNKGLPDFNLLQEREQIDNKLLIELRSKELPATVVVFDILMLNGKDLTKLKLIERKKILDKVVEDSERIRKIVYSEKIKRLWQEVKKLNIEGIVLKKKDSKYEFKRSENWIKIKNFKSIDCVVIGYTKEKREISALLLALFKGKKLFYIGRVASGLSEEIIDYLLKRLKKVKKLEIENMKINAKKEIIFVKPEQVAEIRFLEVTKENILRVPVLLKLRDDKEARDCSYEQLLEFKNE